VSHSKNTNILTSQLLALLRERDMRADAEELLRQLWAADKPASECPDGCGRVAERFHMLFALIEAMPSPVFLKDDAGRYVICNRAFCELLGLSFDDILGRTVHDILPAELARMHERMDNELTGATQRQSYEAHIRDASGQPRYAVFNKTAYLSMEGESKGILGVIVDISERRQAERALAAAKREADTANRAKEEFLANLSHEVRTPLHGVQGMLQLLKTTPLSPEQRGYVDQALASARGLSTILSDLLDLSRLASCTLQPLTRSFELAPFVGDVADRYRHMASLKGLELHVELGEDLPREILADPQRLRQILVNLVGNAVKFTDAGSVGIFVHGRFEDAGGLYELAVDVVDTGIGIHPDEQARIFELFHQLDGSTTRRHDGAGLGLAVVSRLLDVLGGDIDVWSEPGRGSRFTIQIPVLPAPRRRNPDERREQARPLTALVVEADDARRLALAGMLRELGHHVATVRTGRQALSALAGACYDVAFLGLDLPGGGGVAAARRVRAADPRDFDPRMPLVCLLPDPAVRNSLPEFDEQLAFPPDKASLRNLLTSLQD
jgi:PAS domain S-box-containing protein